MVNHRDDIIAAQVGAEKKQKQAEKLHQAAAAQCDLINDRNFWRDLEIVICDLEPICFATNCTQSNSACPDQVLLSLAGMYRHFSAHSEVAVCDGMKTRLEKQWKAIGQDQYLFIFALILNPYEKLERFGDSAGVSTITLNACLIEVCRF